MAKLYRTKDGTKLYPVCSWEKNQHKLYNAYDRAILRRDEEETDAAYAEVERVEEALAAFDRYVINGLVYAPYKIGQVIKDIITAYDVRGDIIRYCK